MSPVTGFAIVASTRSIRLAASTVAVALKAPGAAKVIVRPWIVPLPALTALTTPCGVDQSWACRSTSASARGGRLGDGVDSRGIGGKRREQQECGQYQDERSHA